MKSITRNNIRALATGALFTSVTSLQAVVIVDHFDAPALGQSVSVTNGTTGSSQTDVKTGMTVLGGSREIYIQVQTVYDVGSLVAASANSVTSPDFFTYSNDANVDSLCRLTWDASGSGLNADLSAENQFMLYTAFNDLPTKYTITFETFGVGGGTSTQTLNTGILYSGSLSFPFGGFVGTANPADVDKIVLTIEGGRSTDATCTR